MMSDLIDRLLTRAMRLPGVPALWRRLGWGSLPLRVRFGLFDRPAYAYGVYWAARLASGLGMRSITAVELGVAGGRGLIALESIADAVGKHFDIEVRVVGCDGGSGMPTPVDYRDLPHVWGRGFYGMDEASLRQRLRADTDLRIGDMAELARRWPAHQPPIGFVAFDLDYYSSTCAALQLFAVGGAPVLPRVYCYFDDTIWPEHACHNEHVGELLAIREFNETHQSRKIAALHGLRHMRPVAQSWNDQIYVMHAFDHSAYTVNLTPATAEATQKPLEMRQRSPAS